MENLIPILALLACPVAMGMMMWMMARGNKSADRSGGDRHASAAPLSLEQLREEQTRLAAQIDRRVQVEASSSPTRSAS